MNLQVLASSFNKIKNELLHLRPISSVVLGSGWSSIAENLDICLAIDYSEIPVMQSSSIKGHSGKLQIVEVSGRQYLLFLGRHHLYEGIGWEPVAFPVYLTKQLNIPTILLTNSAGSLSKDISPGSLMIIDDHINDMGVNPLCQQYDPFWGTQFPDQTSVYSIDIRKHLDAACKKFHVDYCHGIYTAKAGPTYETPAETHAQQVLGASAVGMSTVPEAILANSLGMQVGGLSCITNYAAGLCEGKLIHDNVLSETARMQTAMKQVIFETLLAI